MQGPQLRLIDRTRVLFEGKEYLFFGGNDYHRLANHPETVAACQQEALSSGLGSSGSRVTTGNHPLYRQLEKKLAAFLHVDEVVLCSGGYLSNTMALEALSHDYQRFFIDIGAHPSLREPATRLPRERVSVFRHADPSDLARRIEEELRPGERPLVLTDGVAPLNGELLPLGAYWEVVRRRDGLLLVDDAHGIGTIGPSGRGSLQAAKLPSTAFVQTGTLSKALGAFGGLVAGGAGLLKRVLAHSRTFVGATPIPPPIAAAALRSIEILEANPEWVSDLQERVLCARITLEQMGFDTGRSPAPILSVSYFDTTKNERLRAILLEHEIYAPLIRDYPGSTPGGQFRFSLSSAHTDPEIERLLMVVALSARR